MVKMIDETSKIYPFCYIDPTAVIQEYCIVGYRGRNIENKQHHLDVTTKIGHSVTIDPYCLVYVGAELSPYVHLDPYCRVGRNTTIGKATEILYGSRVHDDVKIGSNCIIAGNVSNRITIGDRVSHHGRLSHSYNRPSGDWHDTDEPSMTIGNDVVIGAGSLIIGDVHIGNKVYVAGGEIVRKDVPSYSIVYHGNIISSEDWNGSLKDSGFWSN